MWAPRFNPFAPHTPTTMPALEAEKISRRVSALLLKICSIEKKCFNLTLGHCGLSVLNRAVSVCQLQTPNLSILPHIVHKKMCFATFSLFFFHCIYCFWLSWVSVAGWVFLWLQRVGGHSSCGAWGSPWGGFSPGARDLGRVGSIFAGPGQQSVGLILVVHGHSCPAAYGIFPNQGSNPCLLH